MVVLFMGKKNKVVSQGWNYYIRNISSNNANLMYKKGKKVSIHAEEDALRKADPRKLKGASLYVVRKSCTGDLVNSTPCDRCSSIINSCMKKYGLKAVYYSS
jgi:deoxycytidylate deaminase